MSVRCSIKLNSIGSVGALAALGLSLMAASGCTRTSDGTIVAVAPPGYTWMRDRTADARFGRRQQRIATYPPAPVETAPVRVAPAPPRNTGAQRVRRPTGPYAPRIGVRAPFQQSKTGKSLNCRNEQIDGRVKVVCE